MSASTFVVTWVLQSTVLGLVAVLLPALFRLRDPKALPSWWGITTGLVVVMPLLPLLSTRPPAVPGAVVTFVEQASSAVAPALGVAPMVPPVVWLSVVWFLGVVARLGWLVTGQRRLRRLAACGVRVENDPALERARRSSRPERPAAVCSGARACRRGGRGRPLRLRLCERLRARPCRVARAPGGGAPRRHSTN